MSTHATPGDTPVWLTVSFDAEQLGSQLVWLASENRENLYEPYGPFAGSLRLPKNHPRGVEVRGYGKKALQSFTVESAVLVTVPVDPQVSPSPFTGHDVAVVPLKGFPVARQIVFDPHIDRAYGITALPEPLDIGNEDGAWNLSMVMTVAIRTAGENGAVEVARRVFHFDPESYVGNGTRPLPTSP